MVLPFFYEDFELGDNNIHDEYAFFEAAMSWLEMNCPDLCANVYFLFVSYLQGGTGTFEAMEDAFALSGVYDTLGDTDDCA